MSTSNTHSDHVALLVIDAQVGILGGAEPAYQRDAVVAHIGELIAKARATGVPVIYLQHDGDKGEPLESGKPGWAIEPALAPAKGDLVIRKRASDSFYETTLQKELAARGIAHLVVTGLRTERCVDTTCRQAVSMGYDVTLAADAHTTKNTDVLSASQIIAHTNDNLDDFGNDAHIVLVQKTRAIAF